MKRLFTVCVAASFAATLLAADASQEENQRLQAAANVLSEVQSSNHGISPDLFHRAYCVVVIPGMKKAGFMFSGKYGRGYASCRADTGWSAPVAMRVEGGGFGFQAGAAESDVIMLVMDRKGMNGILASKFTLGGDASVAAGPVGAGASAQTDASMHADILTWSRSKGIFGGISLDGATLRPDEDGDKALYGHKVDSKDVLQGQVPDPVTSDPFTQDLREFGGAHRAA